MDESPRTNSSRPRYLNTAVGAGNSTAHPVPTFVVQVRPNSASSTSSTSSSSSSRSSVRSSPRSSSVTATITPDVAPAFTPSPAKVDNAVNELVTTEKLVAEKLASEGILPDIDGKLQKPEFADVVRGPPSSSSQTSTELGCPTVTAACASVESQCHPIRANLFLFLKFIRMAYNEIRRRKVSYTLGFLSVFFVVFIVGVALTLTKNIPMVFARMAETKHGERDIVLYPLYGGFYKIDYNKFSDKMRLSGSEATRFSYHTPRISISSVPFFTPGICPDVSSSDFRDPAFLYYGPSRNPASTCASRYRQSPDVECLRQACDEVYYSGLVVAIDTARESRMEFGREWKYPPIPSGSCYVVNKFARLMNVTVGDTIVVRLDLRWPLGGIFRDLPDAVRDQYFNQFFYRSGIVYVPLTIALITNGAEGKVGSSDDDAIFVEYSNFLSSIIPNMWPQTAPSVTSTLSSADLYEYAQEVHMNLPPSRLEVYSTDNYDNLQTDVTNFASDVLFLAGFNQLGCDLDVLEFEFGLRFAILFLGLIITLVITIMVLLSIMLIYSLLMVNVETRTFEIGLLRIVGTTKPGIILLMGLQALFYSIPAWILGLIFAQLLNFGISKFLNSALSAEVTASLDSKSVGICTALAFLIPAFASIHPIRKALGLSMIDALDHSRAKTTVVSYSIRRFSDVRVDWGFLLVGFILTVFGASIYYLLPYSIVSFDFGLLLNILFWILLGMLLGLILLALNFEHLLETIIVNVTMFWSNLAIRRLVLQNLSAHRPRNRKTTLMFSLSLAFIIFVAVSFQLELKSSSYDTLRLGGTRLYVEADCFNGLQSVGVKQMLENYVLSNPNVESVAWFSRPLNDLISPSKSNVMNLGHVFDQNYNIFGISPNLYDIMSKDFVLIGKVRDTSNGYSLSEQLYTVAGSYSSILSANADANIGVYTIETQYLVETEKPTERNSIYKYSRLEQSCTMGKSPIFSFSRIPSGSGDDVLVSFPTFVRLTHGALSSVDDIPMKRLQIRLKMEDSIVKKDIDAVFDDIRQYVRRNGICASVRNVQDDLNDIETASTLLNYALLFFAGMALIISSFSLIGSMYTNIHEQGKEIGILRALGCTRWFVEKLYVLEAWMILNAASLLGVIIGTIVGVTITLQRQLFTDLPIGFTFPWQYLVLNCVLGAIVAVQSAFWPTRRLLKNPIVGILRFNLS